MDYYAVRCGDFYLAQEGKASYPDSLTFDRVDMQLFTDRETARQHAIKYGIVINDKDTWIVNITEQGLIDYIKETGVILGKVEKQQKSKSLATREVIEYIKSIVPNPFHSNVWYTGKLNGHDIEVGRNRQGYYQIRMLQDTIINLPDGTKRQGKKQYVHYRINKKNELVKA